MNEPTPLPKPPSCGSCVHFVGLSLKDGSETISGSCDATGLLVFGSSQWAKRCHLREPKG